MYNIKKTYDPILRKLSDGLTETDKSDFIGCCPNNVERPKFKYIHSKKEINKFKKPYFWPILHIFEANFFFKKSGFVTLHMGF